MPVLINFKICDNCADCNGIKVCPVGAFHWDEENRTIAVDKDKCMGCGLCGTSCTNDAIAYVETQEEADELQKEIDNDPRTIADLFVERYGAMPINNQYTFESSLEKVNNRINSNRPVIMEFNTEENINCLLKSIKISEIVKEFDEKATYSKFIIKPEDLEKYGISEVPCLKLFRNGKHTKTINGYYEEKDKQKLFDLLKN